MTEENLIKTPKKARLTREVSLPIQRVCEVASTRRAEEKGGLLKDILGI